MLFPVSCPSCYEMDVCHNDCVCPVCYGPDGYALPFWKAASPLLAKLNDQGITWAWGLLRTDEYAIEVSAWGGTGWIDVLVNNVGGFIVELFDDGFGDHFQGVTLYRGFDADECLSVIVEGMGK